MMNDHPNPIDLKEFFNWIGNIALSSSRGFNTDHADLSDWLNTPETKGITDPNFLPVGYFKELMLLEINLEDQGEWEFFFPLFDQLHPADQHNRVETTDLMVATTLLAPLAERIWEEKQGA